MKKSLGFLALVLLLSSASSLAAERVVRSSSDDEYDVAKLGQIWKAKLAKVFPRMDKVEVKFEYKDGNNIAEHSEVEEAQALCMGYQVDALSSALAAAPDLQKYLGEVRPLLKLHLYEMETEVELDTDSLKDSEPELELDITLLDDVCTYKDAAALTRELRQYRDQHALKKTRIAPAHSNPLVREIREAKPDGGDSATQVQ
jgi:hypothetical protein